MGVKRRNGVAKGFGSFRRSEKKVVCHAHNQTHGGNQCQPHGHFLFESDVWNQPTNEGNIRQNARDAGKDNAVYAGDDGQFAMSDQGCR